MKRYTLSDFDYALPPELIAQVAGVRTRAGSRLAARGRRGRWPIGPSPTCRDSSRRGDLVVFNDTRVIKARLLRARPTGGKVELLLERALAADEAVFQLRASHPPKPGWRTAAAGRRARDRAGARRPVLPAAARRHRVAVRLPRAPRRSAAAALHRALPRMPPTPRATRRSTRATRARRPRPRPACTSTRRCSRSSRPPASRSAWVTLHVGAGTFQPVEAEDLAAHRMHAEWYRIAPETVAAIDAARERGGRIVAVGTTSLRALEAAADDAGRVRAGEAETRLFITPGYRFRVVERLLTNFHLPRVDPADARVGVRRPRSHSRCLRARDPRALPLLQLRRRDAPRARAAGKLRRAPPGRCYNRRDAIHAAGDVRSRAPRPARNRARPRRHARVHAGRHLWHGQGDGAERARAARRADRARQHVSPVAATRRRGHRRARRAASVHGLGARAAHRLRRLPGVEPRSAAQGARGRRGVRVPRQRRPAPAHARDLDADPARARLGHRHGVRRVHRVPRDPRRSGGVDGAVGALGAALARRIRPPRQCARAVRHRAGRHVPRSARRVARGDRRHRLRRLRDRRDVGRRAEGRNARGARAHGAAAPAPTGRAT